MGHPASIPSLKAVLQDEREHAMVRHEAAEALGAMGDDRVLEFLQVLSSPSVLSVFRHCIYVFCKWLIVLSNAFLLFRATSEALIPSSPRVAMWR
jgi:hypothetical protein